MNGVFNLYWLKNLSLVAILLFFSQCRKTIDYDISGVGRTSDSGASDKAKVGMESEGVTSQKSESIGVVETQSGKMDITSKGTEGEKSDGGAGNVDNSSKHQPSLGTESEFNNKSVDVGSDD